MGKQWKQWETLFSLGSKITADGDCSHEIKRRLLLGKKPVTKLDSILKSRDITLATKVCLVEAMVFPVVMYRCESWTVKKAEHRRIWCFWTVVLEKTLESPWGCKEIQPVHLKGGQSWIFIGRTDAEAGTTILWPPDGKNWLIGKDPDAEKDWGQEFREGDDRGWGGWMASPTPWTWVWANSRRWWGTGRPGVLQSTGSQKESDTTEQLKNNNKRFTLPKGMSLSELSLAPFRRYFSFQYPFDFTVYLMPPRLNSFLIGQARRGTWAPTAGAWGPCGPVWETKTLLPANGAWALAASGRSLLHAFENKLSERTSLYSSPLGWGSGDGGGEQRTQDREEGGVCCCPFTSATLRWPWRRKEDHPHGPLHLLWFQAGDPPINIRTGIITIKHWWHIDSHPNRNDGGQSEEWRERRYSVTRWLWGDSAHKWTPCQLFHVSLFKQWKHWIYKQRLFCCICVPEEFVIHELEREVVHISRGILCSHRKEQICVQSSEVDGLPWFRR